MNDHPPPRLAVWCLGRLLPAAVRESFLGDLAERYTALRSGGTSRMAADLWYWGEVLRSRPWTLRRAARRPATGTIRRQRPGMTLPARWLETLARDVRLGLRGLLRTPGFTLAAVLTLGLGTGAATAVFSLVEGVVLRPLAFPDPDRLVTLWEGNRDKGLTKEPVSPVNFLDYRGLDRVFEDAAAWWRPEVNLSDEAGEPIRVTTVETTENLFDVLGVRPALGREFPRDSTLEGNEPEVVISDRLWRGRFGASAAVLGRTVKLNGRPFTVVGVMPPGFHFPDDTDVWQRLGWRLALHSRYAHFMGAVGRLRPGVTLPTANARLAALARRLGEEYPASNGGWGVHAIRLDREVTGVFRPALLALLGAAALLLVIACINVASLVLARSTGRRAEMAVRAALGAGRRRLLVQLLVESLLLAMAGVLVGLGTATLALRAFLAWSPIEIPRATEVGVNGVVLGFAVVVSGVTAMAFGLLPALQLSRAHLAATLRGRSRGVAGGHGGQWARRLLVVAQVALAVVLLSGAGVLVRSVLTMLRVDSGVQPAGVVTADLELSGAQYRNWSDVARFYGQLLDGIRARPSVLAAGASNTLPLAPGWRLAIGVPGLSSAPGEQPMAQYHTVDEGWFAALGVPVLEGRTFRPTDDAARPGVVVVNEALVQRYFPNRDPVGRRITITTRNIGPLGQRLVDTASVTSEQEIVGVVGDVSNVALGTEPEPAVYFPQRQFPFSNMHLFVRGRGDTAGLLALVRAEVRRLDPSLPIADTETLDQVLAAPADPPRLVMSILSAFALLALLLAAVGIYGTLSYTVNSRRREIGIRMALGARPTEILRMVLRQGAWLGLAGGLVGLAGALLADRLLATLLFGVTPTDPLTLATVVTLATLVALLACLIPGQRAAATQPMQTLRTD